MLALHKNSPLITGGIVFLVVAVLHVIRVVQNTSITIGATEIPLGVSIIGAIVTGLLGFWLLAAARQR